MSKTVLLAVALGLAACGGSSGPATHFNASMNSANEVPALTTQVPAATGTATYTTDGGSVDYTVTWSGLSANASAGHIHVGSATESGGVVVPLTIPASAQAPSG